MGKYSKVVTWDYDVLFMKLSGVDSKFIHVVRTVCCLVDLK